GNEPKLGKHRVTRADVTSLLGGHVAFAGRIVEPAHPETRWLLLGETARRKLAVVVTRRGDLLWPVTCRSMRRNERRLDEAHQAETEPDPHGDAQDRRPAARVRAYGPGGRDHRGGRPAVGSSKDPPAIDRAGRRTRRDATREGCEARSRLPDDAEADRSRASRRVLNRAGERLESQIPTERPVGLVAAERSGMDRVFEVPRERRVLLPDPLDALADAAGDRLACPVARIRGLARPAPESVGGGQLLAQELDLAAELLRAARVGPLGCLGEFGLEVPE